MQEVTLNQVCGKSGWEEEQRNVREDLQCYKGVGQGKSNRKDKNYCHT